MPMFTNETFEYDWETNPDYFDYEEEEEYTTPPQVVVPKTLNKPKKPITQPSKTIQVKEVTTPAWKQDSWQTAGSKSQKPTDTSVDLSQFPTLGSEPIKGETPPPKTVTVQPTPEPINLDDLVSGIQCCAGNGNQSRPQRPRAQGTSQTQRKAKLCRSLFQPGKKCPHKVCHFAHTKEELDPYPCGFDTCKKVKFVDGKYINDCTSRICTSIHPGESKDEWMERTNTKIPVIKMVLHPPPPPVVLPTRPQVVDAPPTELATIPSLAKKKKTRSKKKPKVEEPEKPKVEEIKVEEIKVEEIKVEEIEVEEIEEPKVAETKSLDEELNELMQSMDISSDDPEIGEMDLDELLKELDEPNAKPKEEVREEPNEDDEDIVCMEVPAEYMAVAMEIAMKLGKTKFRVTPI